tara:strand:+ start:4587 stop:4952 length:366 start_codon:yes stop_codon:yes gene_type:complete
MEKNNKLIAEFMGLNAQILSTNNVHSWNDAPFYYITEDSKEKVMEGVSEYSKYHTSWDWLMPVVEKIEALKYRVEISHNGCLIESHKDLDTARINSGIGEIEPTKLKATYKAVVEFINKNT